MSTIIGSARIDENGHAHGGKAGDQTGREVSTQDFYVSSKGWYVIRAISGSHANRLAKAMQTACDNKNIGYDQYERYGVIKHHTDTKVKTECDCSSLVRECIIEATGIDPGDFNTESEAKTIIKTGLFYEKIKYVDGLNLYTGDILVTCSKGHTVIVTKGISRTAKAAHYTLKYGDKDTGKGGLKGFEVTKLQKNLNSLGIKDDDNKKLKEDGELGKKSEQALRRFQKLYKLEIDGVYGPKSYETMKKAIA